MMKKTSVVLDNRITRLVVLTYSNLFKDGLSLKIKILHIHLYFIATPYLYNYALVEDIDNWTRSYILIIIYWNRKNNI